MTNNKQSMKLYTEEQVRIAIDIALNGINQYYTPIIDRIKPIELPSDEEIRNISIKHYVNKSACFYFEIGAKWMRDMYQDKMEAEIIKQCAEQSTSEASQYAEGYSEGYKRALDYMADTIKNKIEIKGNGTNIFTTTGTTTSTAFLCAQFVGEGRTTTSNPRCIKCGKEIWQHPIISHTI